MGLKRKSYLSIIKIIDENTYDISKIDMTRIEHYIDNGVVVIHDEQYERLKRSIN